MAQSGAAIFRLFVCGIQNFHRRVFQIVFPTDHSLSIAVMENGMIEECLILSATELQANQD